MQYSKFNSPENVVRDVTSTAQAICIDDLKSGYFNHVNVNLYLATMLVLPVAAGIGSTVTILRYYNFITEKLKSRQHQPSYVAAIITGMYITFYIISLDFIAIYYYKSNRINLEEYNNSFSLLLTWITLIAEYVTSLIVLSILVLKYVHNRTIDKWHVSRNIRIGLFTTSLCMLLAILGTSTVTSNYVFSIAAVPGILSPPVLVTSLFLFGFITIDFLICFIAILICFIAIPIIFVSAHIGYISAAWLTEPSKTTSVAIISMAITFYIFVINRFLFKCIRDSEIWNKYCSWFGFNKISGKEQYTVSGTFFLGLSGVGLAALQISAFYTLPLPTIKLADYLDNVVNLSLIILAALVSYKIIPLPESDFKDFMQEFNKSYKQNVVREGKQTFRTNLSIASYFSASLSFTENGININSQDEMRTASINLENSTLTIQIPRNNSNDSIVVPISNVKLHIGTFQKFQRYASCHLNEALLEFTCTSADLEGRTAKCEIDLEDAWIENRDTSLSCPASAIEFHLHISADNLIKQLRVSRIFCNKKNESETESIRNEELILNMSISGVCVKPSNTDNKLGLWCHFREPVYMEIPEVMGTTKKTFLPHASVPVDIQWQHYSHHCRFRSK